MLSSLEKKDFVDSKILFSPTLIIALILFSFELKWSNNTRWSIFLVYLIFFLYRNLQKRSNISWIPTLYFLIFILSSFLFFKEKPARALQFLSYGYDNAFHFTQFRGFIDTSWYPNVDFVHWFTDFQLFTKGPLGYYSITSFILNPFTLVSKNPEFLLILFAAFQVFILFLLAWLVYSCILDSAKTKATTKVIYAAFSLLIVFCLPATLLFNGFAPYFFSIVLILIWLNYDARNPNKWQKNLTLSLLIYCVSIVTPAPAVFLFFGALLVVFRELKSLAIRGNKTLVFKNLSPFVLVGSFVLWTFSKSSAGLGWRQLLQAGGLQNINLISSIFIFFITFILLIRNFKRSIDDDLAVIVISGLFSVLALSALTITFTGDLQYYAIKQIYVALFFSVIYCVRSFKTYNLKALMNFSLIAVLIIPIFNPIFFKGGFMGVPPRVLIHTVQEVYWNTAPVNAMRLTSLKGLSKNDGSVCYVWRSEDPFTDKDLSSRWLNAMKSHNIISESCFSAYWNNGQLSDAELQEKLANLENDFVIVTDILPTAEVLENIKYVNFSKKR